MRRLATICFLLGLAPGSAILAAWTLDPCSLKDEKAQSRVAYRRALESAAPGSSLYTPHVFPKDQGDVVENFLYYHRNAFSRTQPSGLPEQDRLFFELLEKNRIRFQMLRVVNWTPLRCGPRKERDFYYLLRAFDRSTGEELLRASIEDNGHVARVRHKPEEGSLPSIPDLPQVGASIQARSGLRSVNAQYVATWGTLRCDEVQPCVAFQDGAEIYLAGTQELAPVYRLDPSGRRLSLRRDLTPDARGSVIDSLREEGRELVSLGFDLFTSAVVVHQEQWR